MAAITNITTAAQTRTTVGAFTGSLDTSALTGDYTVKARFHLDSGETAIVALEDTANASAFSEAIQCAVFHVVGGMPVDDVAHERRKYDISGTRFGVANSKLRFNLLSITGGTCKLYGWLEQ